jgi:hypothetical protein
VDPHKPWLAAEHHESRCSRAAGSMEGPHRSEICPSKGNTKPAALEAGGVLKAAEHSKRKKYAELGSKFLPLIFETHGRPSMSRSSG